jgi:signal peptidase I
MTINESDAKETPASKSKVWRIWQENLTLVAIALCLALLIRTFVAEPRYIPSDSMLPTLYTGDRLVIEKISYKFHLPKTENIILCQPPYRRKFLPSFCAMLRMRQFKIGE